MQYQEHQLLKLEMQEIHKMGFIMFFIKTHFEISNSIKNGKQIFILVEILLGNHFIY